MENKKLNVKWFMVFLPIVSIGGSMIITDWDGSGVSIFLDIVFWTFILGFLYFMVTALICAIFKVEIPEIKDSRNVERAREMAKERAMWAEEDEKEKRIETQKALNRIKKLQRD